MILWLRKLAEPVHPRQQVAGLTRRLIVFELWTSCAFAADNSERAGSG